MHAAAGGIAGQDGGQGDADAVMSHQLGKVGKAGQESGADVLGMFGIGDA